LRDWAETLLDERRLRDEGYFHAQPVRRAWSNHIRGQQNAFKLWTILMFQSWLENQGHSSSASHREVTAAAI